jgi:DnaJ-class molecular chaperone
MASRDLYDILGVSRTASADEVRRAHRKLALQYHPDRNKSKDAAAKFAEVQEAYEVLSDADKRKQYDDFIRLGGSPGAFGSSGPTGGSGGARPGAPGQGPFGGGEAWTTSDSETFESIFGDMFGGRGGGRGGGRARSGGGASQRARARERMEAEVSVPLETAIKGGRVGLVLDDGSVDVPIPAGVEDEELVSVPGRLDLMVRVRIAPHAWLSRDGRDLSYDLPLSIVEATLGASIEVPLPTGGGVTLKIPPGTASGKKLRIAGKGVPAGGGRPAGDLFVVIQIVPPKDVNDLTGSLLREIAGSLDNPRAKLPHLQLRP